MCLGQLVMKYNSKMERIFKFMFAFLLCTPAVISQTGITIPECYNGADPCSPLYPCPVGVQVPQGTDCQSHYQCVTEHDWVYLGNGCEGLGDFNVNKCMCDNLTPCGIIDNLCPDGVTSPPVDPGIAPEPCAPSGPCTAESEPVPDQHTCSRYFTCPTGTWEPSTCPFGEIFDPRRGCVIARPNNLDVCTSNACQVTTSVMVTVEAPTCHNETDICAPTYPCPTNALVPSKSNCNSYYHCVTPLDWVFFDNGCDLVDDFDANQCMCQNRNDVSCTDLDFLCPDGVTTPPGDPGVVAEPCVAAGPCDANSPDVPDVHTCSRYFRCILQTWTELTCPAGEIFNPNPDGGCVEARNINLGVCNDKSCVFP